jgi:hypothetical protein
MLRVRFKLWLHSALRMMAAPHHLVDKGFVSGRS